MWITLKDSHLYYHKTSTVWSLSLTSVLKTPPEQIGKLWNPCSSRSKLSPDASPQKIINTLRLPSGVGATCVLKTPFNSTLDQLAQTLNPSANNSKTLAARYFDSMCLDSFTQGVPLSNFVPPPPSPAPSDDPDPRFEDGLWNFTVAPPTTVRGESVPQCCQKQPKNNKNWKTNFCSS